MRSREVDTHVVLSAIHFGWVEKHVRFLCQVMTELLGGQVECTDVDPREISAFGFMDLKHRQFGMKKIAQETEILIDLFVEFIEPSFRFVVRSHLSDQAEGVESVDFMHLEGMIDLRKEFFVGNENVRAEQTGDIKGFAGRGADTEIGIVDDDGCERCVGMSGESELAMNLVGEHEQMLAAHDSSQTLEFFPTPHTTGWVVRVAEQEDVSLFGFGLNVCPIDLEAVIDQHEGRRDKFTAHVLDAGEEAVVGRSEGEHTKRFILRGFAGFASILRHT